MHIFKYSSAAAWELRNVSARESVIQPVVPTAYLRGAFLNDGCELVKSLLWPTRHKRWSVAGPLFSAGDTHADELNLFRLQLGRASNRVGKPLVSSVDDDVPFLD